MSNVDIYKANPLHGTSLETVLTTLVDHYGFEILSAYMNLNCFKQNPSIESSLKFLKKTAWAQEKVEAFYMYQYHSLPKADDQNFELPPRDRIVPQGLEQRPPKELSLDDAEELRVKKAKKTRERASVSSPANPWGDR
ncbi:MAG: VF530 family DNA-binding protein [Colwellia sp.]